MNPVGYFEIPVTNMNRAVEFYEHVFELRLERKTIDGYAMALFPAEDNAAGASGALAEGDVYLPGKEGPVLYFSVASIDAVLARVADLEGRVLYARKSLGIEGWVAEIEDSEGNRVALHEG